MLRMTDFDKTQNILNESIKESSEATAFNCLFNLKFK